MRAGAYECAEKIHPNVWFHSLYVPKIGWLRTGYQGCIRAVRRRLRAIQPDIVHGQGTERDCAISAVFSGFPNVLTIHGNMRLVVQATNSPPFSYFWLMAQLEKITLPRTHGVVAITRYTQEAVAPCVGRTWLIPNAVDASFFDVQRAPQTPPVILCVGNICLRKNQNAFIRALDSLAARQSFHLLFLGSSEESDPYGQEFVRLVAARPWCRYEGFANREQLKAWLSRAALLALPSLEDNCPMVILEAMAAGVPVAAAQVGGIPDIVENGKTGRLFNPASAESMEKAIANALQDETATAQMALTARAVALERFLPRVIAHQHLGVYEEVLRSRS